MHRGCVPFVTPDQFNNIYWPTLKPIIEELWADGHQTLFYAEGNWDHHLESFAELPDRSIVYHVDQGDIFKAHEVLGDKFCLSGGIPNVLLGHRPPDEVRAVLQEGDRRRRPRRRLHHGRQRHHAERCPGREHAGHDRDHAGIRRLLIGHCDIAVNQATGSRSRRDAGGGLPPRVDAAVPPGTCLPWARKRQQNWRRFMPTRT